MYMAIMVDYFLHTATPTPTPAPPTTDGTIQSTFSELFLFINTFAYYSSERFSLMNVIIFYTCSIIISSM